MKRLPLWPSSAYRWTKCPGSARVTQAALGLPEEDKPYADEGTIAHALLEANLKKVNPHTCLKGKLLAEMREVPSSKWLPEDQMRVISEAANEVRAYAELTGSRIWCESYLPVTFDNHQISCRCDIILVSGTHVMVLDYKHGANEPVSVEDNQQLHLYALALSEIGNYKDRHISAGIIQPRGVGEGWSSVAYTRKELIDIRIKFITAVERAYQTPVEYVAGRHCSYCPGLRGMCPKQLEMAINGICARAEYGDEIGENTIDPPWWLLGEIKAQKTFLTSLDKYANTWLRAGNRIPGWSMEECAGRRRWYDPAEVAPMLAELLGGEPSDYERPVPPSPSSNPITLTEAEKLAKKKKVDLTALIETPRGLKRVRSDDIDATGAEELTMEGVE